MTTKTASLKPIARRLLQLAIRGTTPLIMHQWSEKAKSMMRDKQQQGKKTKTRDLRDPQQEAEAATYKTADGKIGIPGLALKTAILGAAHKDLGIEKTLVRKALFLRCNDPGLIIPIEYQSCVVREDQVRVGMGSADLRYRPEFHNWSCTIQFEVDAELLQAEDVVTLVNRAGFGVGILEWRPEKGGEYGRFEVDTTSPLIFEEL